MAEVLFERVKKVYPGGVEAVKEFSLSIRDGEFVVLVGPSGCGKSTTLRMVAGLEEISSGVIKIGDRVVNDVPPKNRDVAMVFQNYALYPHMTVRDNMAFGLKLRKIPKKEIASRIEEVAATLELEDLLHRRPKVLSGGQRQRVALGRAIVRQPAVFLFDEPLSNLDAKLRVQMRVELSRLHRQLGTTMIYVTHDQVEAMTMGERIVVMHDGYLMQVDSPLELYNFPASQYVAGFLGTPPMNFFEGTLQAHADALVFRAAHAMELRVPSGCTAALAAYRGRDVVMGVRPEDVGSMSAEQTAGAQRITATVDFVEPMGAETLAHMRLANGSLFISRAEAQRRFRIGETIELSVNPGKLHFFDPASGATISPACNATKGTR